MNKQKSITYRIKLHLSPVDWSLNELDVFLESKQERDLAGALIKLGYNVTPITFNDKDKLENGCADIIVHKNRLKFPIEITTTAPSNSEIGGGINSPHGHQWAKVSSRALPLAVHSFKHNLPCFLVMNNKWNKYPHVNHLINNLKEFKCHLLLSDFVEGWSNKIAEEINKILEEIK